LDPPRVLLPGHFLWVIYFSLFHGGVGLGG